MKDFIVWFNLGSEEDFITLKAIDVDEARLEFHKICSYEILDCHEIVDNGECYA